MQSVISLFLFAFSTLSFASKGPTKVEFLNEQIIGGDQIFEGLAIGGISGASFDHRKKDFLFLSDDKKNPRFYKLQIKNKNPYRLEITEQVFLREKDSTRLERNIDPEAILLSGKQIFVASEGQQIFAVFEPPEILQFSLSGALEKIWPPPSVFWKVKKPFEGAKIKGVKTGGAKKTPSRSSKELKFFSSLPHNQILFGPEENKGFESLAMDFQSQVLYTAAETPLRQDQNSSSGHWIRLGGFSLKDQKLIAQYGYRIKSAATGLVEMHLLKPLVFLTLEREFLPSNKVRLFLTDCAESSNFYRQVRLPKHFEPCKKSLLFDFDHLPEGITADNLEAMTLGPPISPKGRLLVIASDNNFNPAKQINQILFFKFSEK